MIYCINYHKICILHLCRVMEVIRIYQNITATSAWYGVQLCTGVNFILFVTYSVTEFSSL